MQDVVKMSVAAFHEWRNELLNNGTFQNYDNVHTAYDKHEVHALNKMPSFIHDNDEEWAGDVEIEEPTSSQSTPLSEPMTAASSGARTFSHSDVFHDAQPHAFAQPAAVATPEQAADTSRFHATGASLKTSEQSGGLVSGHGMISDHPSEVAKSDLEVPLISLVAAAASEDTTDEGAAAVKSSSSVPVDTAQEGPVQEQDTPNERMFAKQLDAVEAELLAQRINMG